MTVCLRQPLTTSPTKLPGIAYLGQMIIVGSISWRYEKPSGSAFLLAGYVSTCIEAVERQNITNMIEVIKVLRAILINSLYICKRQQLYLRTIFLPILTISKEFSTFQEKKILTTSISLQYLPLLISHNLSETLIHPPQPLKQRHPLPYNIIIKEQKSMLKQPSTNVKMTNVATIRYKINNKNFQIACYRNKALNYRNGVENDISEVLQTDEIFDNASHGTIAKKADLNKYFQNKTKLEIIQIILERGELQVTDKQRDAQQSSTLAQIINIIVQKCVHPTTKRRFTHEIIKQAIKEIHFAVKTDQPAKKQALQCIKLLQTKYKIARGDMRVKITCKKDAVEKMEKELKKLNIQVVHSEELKGDSLCRVYDIEPNKYRDLSSMCKEGSDITVEVVVNVVVNQSTKDLENQQSTTLQLLHKSDKKEQEQEEETKKQKKEQKTEKKEQKQLKCSTCQHHAIFSLPADQRAHFKTEWHCENVKRKSKNLPPISAEEHQFNKGYN